MISLDDSFNGRAGQAIRSFYLECHMPFLLLSQTCIEAFSETLKQINQALNALEPAPNGVIREDFLEQELKHGLQRVADTTCDLTREANVAMHQVQDIVSLPLLNDTAFMSYVHVAKTFSADTVEKLYAFDAEQTKSLDSVQQSLSLMIQYVQEIDALFQSGDLSIADYRVKQLSDSEPYNNVLDDIESKLNKHFMTVNSTMPADAFINDPDKQKAWQYFNQIRGKTLTREEFMTLKSQLVEVVEVIDEQPDLKPGEDPDLNYIGGKYYVFKNGLIVWWNRSKRTYEVVDDIPEKRVGGAIPKDSIFEDTPLEFLDYVSPGSVVKKVVVKSVQGIIKKNVRNVTKNSKKPNISKHHDKVAHNEYFKRKNERRELYNSIKSDRKTAIETSKTIKPNKPIETTIKGRKVKLRVDIEPDGNKMQIQTGGGSNSFIDERIKPNKPIEPQIPKYIKRSLTKGQYEELVKRLKQGAKYLKGE